MKLYEVESRYSTNKTETQNILLLIVFAVLWIINIKMKYNTFQ